MIYQFYFILAMLIFSTLGLVSSYIPISGIGICFLRSVMGFLFFIIYKIIKKEAFSFKDIKKEFKGLMIESIFLTLSWIFLFEAFKYNIGGTTILYYSAPIIVLIYSISQKKEKNPILKSILIFITFIGLILMIGSSKMNMKSILFASVSAISYSIFIISNKKVSINPNDKNIFNFFIAIIITLPFFLINKDYSIKLSTLNILALLSLGIIHTGIAYLLYLSSMDKLSEMKISLLSYIDPLFSYIFSLIFLHESTSLISIFGVILIFSSLIFSSLTDIKFMKIKTNP